MGFRNDQKLFKEELGRTPGAPHIAQSHRSQVQHSFTPTHETFKILFNGCNCFSDLERF